MGRYLSERTLSLLLICAGAAIAGWTAYSLFSPRLYWLDEYFTIWGADPSLSFSQLVSDRLRTDTHPPAFYLPLHIWLTAFGTSATSTGLFSIVLISSMLVCAGVYAFLRGALLLFAVFVFLLLCSFGLRMYLLELRSYAFAVTVAAVLALAAVMLARSDARPSWTDTVVFMASGSVLSFTHVFGAVLAGSAAAALLVVSVLHRKKPLFFIGLAAGFGFTVIYGAWFLYSYKLGGQLMAGGEFWLEFKHSIVRRELILFSKFALTNPTESAKVPAVVFLGLAVIALWHARDPGVLVLSLMLGGFVAIPFLASLYFPMILARYFLPGLAPLYLLVALLVVERWQTAGDARPMAAVLTAAAILATTVAPPALRADWQDRHLIWHTEPVVRACLTEACANGPLRVWHWKPWASGIPTPQMTEGVYNLVLRDYRVQPELHSNAPLRDVATLQCPVVGWAESTHFNPSIVTEARLLERLRLENPKAVPIAVHRHKSGYALLRTDLPCAK